MAYLSWSREPRELDFQSFFRSFRERICYPAFLEPCLLVKAIESLNRLSESSQFVYCLWSQGDLSIQAAKAKLVAARLSASSANPQIYVSVDKVALLPYLARDLLSQGRSELVIVDDRLVNLRAARELFGFGSVSLFQKLLGVDQVVSDECGELFVKTFFAWGDFEQEILAMGDGGRFALVLDLDGVLFDSRLYRVMIEGLLAG